jgi:hypothetical protein
MDDLHTFARHKTMPLYLFNIFKFSYEPVHFTGHRPFLSFEKKCLGIMRKEKVFV